MTEGPTPSESPTTSLDSVDIQAILAFLPHRYPFLLVDKIVDIKNDDFGIGIKNVTVNEPQFMGHFPGRPIMPGVLIIEGMAQTAGTLCIAARGDQSETPLVYFMTIDNTKFRKPVVPGDVLEYHMTKQRQRGNMWWFSGVAMVNGVKVAESELSAMLIDRKDGDGGKRA
ncbi:MAG: 3-hydroxyacyl-ACP dehydratase FabZ [Cohaesibacteraceae bacterium]